MPRPPKRKKIPKARPSQRPIRAVLFDCYGTLVDWESGLTETLRDLLPEDLRQSEGPTRLFERWECIQFGLLATKYRPYREIMEQATKVLLDDLAVEASDAKVSAVPASVHRWPLFPDVLPAVERLLSRYRVGIVSNMDDSLLRGTLVKFGRMLSPLVTAERSRAYKPHSKRLFELALEDLHMEADQVALAAFGHRYDLGPASEMGFRTVWVNRGGDALPPRFDVDLQVPGLAELCEFLKV